jgi:hypothetical protein
MDEIPKLGHTNGNSEECMGYFFAEVSLCKILHLAQDYGSDLFWCLSMHMTPV